MHSPGATESVATITLPGNWLTVDLDSFDDKTAVQRLVTDRLADIPALAGHEADLVELISRSASLGQSEGVSFAAVLADVYDGDPIVADLALAATPSPARESENADAASSLGIRQALGIQSAVDEPGVRKRAVDDVSLAAGPAVRIARIHDLPLGETGVQLTVLTVQYWLFAPGNDRIVVLNFATPSLTHHKELARQFHTIAESLLFEPSLRKEA
jgi:hypothetical protein